MCRHPGPFIWLLEESFQKAKTVLYLNVKSYNCAVPFDFFFFFSPPLQAYYLTYILLHLVSEASFFDVVNSNQRVSNFSDSVFGL